MECLPSETGESRGNLPKVKLVQQLRDEPQAQYLSVSLCLLWLTAQPQCAATYLLIYPSWKGVRFYSRNKNK